MGCSVRLGWAGWVNPLFYGGHLKRLCNAKILYSSSACRTAADYLGHPLFLPFCMHGLHLTADLTGCQCNGVWLTDAALLLAYCVQAAQTSGLQTVNQLAHTFAASSHSPGGVTATVLLAESHLCIHTWPELQAVTVDVYVCNFGADHSAKAQGLMDLIVAHFAPNHADRQALHRGRAMALPTAH